MRGTPYIYNGDELAMTNAGFQKISDYRDMPTLNEYQFQINHGGDINQFMKRIQFESRDNARTPFQWDASVNAGFTTGNPWIQVNSNYKMINKANQEKDQRSVLNYFRKTTALRHNNPALIYGKYTLLDRSNPDIFAYTRELDGKKFLVLLNFSNHFAKPKIDLDLSKAKILLANYPTPSHNGRLAPYESIVYQMK
jgi:oligo-1,6-glucosidase